MLSGGGPPALFEEVELGVLYDQFALALSVPQRLRYPALPGGATAATMS